MVQKLWFFKFFAFHFFWKKVAKLGKSLKWNISINRWITYVIQTLKLIWNVQYIRPDAWKNLVGWKWLHGSSFWTKCSYFVQNVDAIKMITSLYSFQFRGSLHWLIWSSHALGCSWFAVYSEFLLVGAYFFKQNLCYFQYYEKYT